MGTTATTIPLQDKSLLEVMRGMLPHIKKPLGVTGDLIYYESFPNEHRVGSKRIGDVGDELAYQYSLMAWSLSETLNIKTDGEPFISSADHCSGVVFLGDRTIVLCGWPGPNCIAFILAGAIAAKMLSNDVACAMVQSFDDAKAPSLCGEIEQDLRSLGIAVK